MLHQIELYRQIPKMREEINGFITDCQCHLADWENDREQYRKEKRENSEPAKKARCSAMKYRERIKASQKVLEALVGLDRSLNE